MARTSFLPASRRASPWVSALIIGAFVWMLAGAGACLAGGYCAIAYSESTGKSGRSNGYDNRFAAEERALQECGRDGKVVIWMHNGYIALSRGTGTAWGAGSGSTRREAERAALRNCPGGNANIVLWAYSFD